MAEAEEKLRFLRLVCLLLVSGVLSCAALIFAGNPSGDSTLIAFMIIGTSGAMFVFGGFLAFPIAMFLHWVLAGHAGPLWVSSALSNAVAMVMGYVIFSNVWSEAWETLDPKGMELAIWHLAVVFAVTALVTGFLWKNLET